MLMTSVVIPRGDRVIRWHADIGGKYTVEAFKQYGLEMAITEEIAATNTPQQIGRSKRVGQTLCSMAC